jgi:hypothetical protein
MEESQTRTCPFKPLVAGSSPAALIAKTHLIMGSFCFTFLMIRAINNLAAVKYAGLNLFAQLLSWKQKYPTSEEAGKMNGLLCVWLQDVGGTLAHSLLPNARPAPPEHRYPLGTGIRDGVFMSTIA